MPGRNNHLRSTRWHEDQAQRWNASATIAGGLSATTMTIAIIAAGRLAAAGTMMTTVAILGRPGTRKAGLPVRGRATMTTMTIGGAAGDMAAGTAIRKVTPKRRGAVADNARQI